MHHTRMGANENICNIIKTCATKDMCNISGCVLLGYTQPIRMCATEDNMQPTRLCATEDICNTPRWVPMRTHTLYQEQCYWGHIQPIMPQATEDVCNISEYVLLKAKNVKLRTAEQVCRKANGKTADSWRSLLAVTTAASINTAITNTKSISNVQCLFGSKNLPAVKYKSWRSIHTHKFTFNGIWSLLAAHNALHDWWSHIP